MYCKSLDECCEVHMLETQDSVGFDGTRLNFGGCLVTSLLNTNFRFKKRPFNILDLHILHNHMKSFYPVMITQIVKLIIQIYSFLGNLSSSKFLFLISVCKQYSLFHWHKSIFFYKTSVLVFRKQCSIHDSRAQINTNWQKRNRKLHVHLDKPVS